MNGSTNVHQQGCFAGATQSPLTHADFTNRFRCMQNIAPSGSGGNPSPAVNYPFGTMNMKYFPSGSSSVGRSMWDGWRYGGGYTGSNPRQVYGEPDYKYYRHNYSGPCGCAPPGYMGDPNGENPNIRYVQLDYNSLLGSGVAKQAQTSFTSPLQLGKTGPIPPTYTSCGHDHTCANSGVLKKAKQPVKFQICLGDPNSPETMNPCPKQEVKVYIPNQMIPGNGQCQEDCNGGSGDGGDQKKLQDYEIHIEGQTDQMGSKNIPPPVAANNAPYIDPCGSCKACSIKASPISKKNQLCPFTTGDLLANVKRPVRQSRLRRAY